MATTSPSPVASGLKNQLSMSDFEMEASSIETSSRIRTLRAINALRSALTWLSIVLAVVVLGVSADALDTYYATSVGPEFFLQLWPAQFDVRPTQAFVAGSVVVLVANLVAQVLGEIRAPARYPYRGMYAVAGSLVGFIGALVAIGFYYSVNASTSIDTLQSWSCRWEHVAMGSRPHFGTLCKESKAGLALATLLVPLQIIVLGVACFQVTLDRKVGHLPLKRG